MLKMRKLTFVAVVALTLCSQSASDFSAAVQKFARGPGHPGLLGYWSTRRTTRAYIPLQPTRTFRAVPAPPPQHYNSQATPRRGPVNRFYRR